MDDIFNEEQKILDDALSYGKKLRNGAAFDPGKYDEIVKEYSRLLRQLRRVTKLSDRAAGNLNEHKHDLLDKVHYDALTGIYNRRFMEDSLKRIVKSHARSGETLSFMLMDVDYFKKYNDNYGHSEGDACLKVVAETIAGSLSRADDFAARYGGEEFAVILPDTDESGARYLAGKILENIRKKNIPHEKSEVAGFVTVSIGVTTSAVARAQSGDDYIKQADKALYQSKQKGRNRYTYIDFMEEAQ
jgi:diguanylate cyclase (GGDEF)-like protein